MRDSDSSASRNLRVKEHRIPDVGVRVRVSRGTLSGLRGEVIATTNDGHFVKCLVAIKGWPEGALLLIGSEELE